MLCTPGEVAGWLQVGFLSLPLPSDLQYKGIYPPSHLLSPIQTRDGRGTKEAPKEAVAKPKGQGVAADEKPQVWSDNILW